MKKKKTRCRRVMTMTMNAEYTTNQKIMCLFLKRLSSTENGLLSCS